MIKEIDKNMLKPAVFILLLSFTFTLVVVSTSLSRPGGAAMVLSITGSAKAFDREGKGRILSAMDVLDPGDTLVTGENSTVTIVLFSNNREYTLKSSSKAVVLAGEIQKKQGSLISNEKEVAIELPSNTTINSRRILGSIVRAGPTPSENPPRFVYPADESNVLDGKLIFRWEFPENPGKVKFTLTETGVEKEIYSTVISKNCLKYPVEGREPLQRGREYLVVVSPENAENEPPEILGPGNSARAYFRVLTREKAERIKQSAQAARQQLKEAPDDPTPLIKMMFIYLDNQLFTQALEVGHKLEKFEKMSTNPNLYYYISYTYRMMENQEKAEYYKEKAKKLAR